VPEKITSGPELLLDACVYIDVLQSRAPDNVKSLLTTRLCNHSAIALAELTHLFGHLDPRDKRSAGVWREISGVISDMSPHRLSAPSVRVTGEAGILAGLVIRLTAGSRRSGQTILNDAILYLHGIEQGQTVLTRNIREFDIFDQLVPANRLLLYRAA
jgi:hypothetical protein